MIVLIHKDKNVAKILAAVLKIPLSAQQIGARCNISVAQCYKTLRKLKENGLIIVASKSVSKENPKHPVFLYKAFLDPQFVCIENGKFKIKLPRILHFSNGKTIDLMTLMKFTSKEIAVPSN